MREPHWPRCCSQLSVLVGVHGVDADAAALVSEAHFLERFIQEAWDGPLEAADVKADAERSYAEQRHEDRAAEELALGDALFACRSCRSVYVSSYAAD